MTVARAQAVPFLVAHAQQAARDGRDAAYNLIYVFIQVFNLWGFLKSICDVRCSI